MSDYFLNSIAALVVLAAGACLRAEPIESGPIFREFSPARVGNSGTVWQLAQTPGGQILAGSERIGFYEGGQWTFLPQPVTEAVRGMVVDGTDLWVASYHEIGHLKLPLSASSRYEKLDLPEIRNAGQFWQLVKVGQDLVAAAQDAIWIINPQTGAVRSHPLRTKSRNVILNQRGQTLIVQTGTAFWHLEGGELIPAANPLPDPEDKTWHWCDSDYVLTHNALYARENGAYRRIADMRDLDSAVVTAATRWGRYLAVTTNTRGLALIDVATGEISYLSRNSGLPSLSTMSVLVDNQSRLWVGGARGVTLFESLRFGRGFYPADPPALASRIGGLLVSYADRTDYFRPDGTEEHFVRAYSAIASRYGAVLGEWHKVRIGTNEISTPGNKVEILAELPDGHIFAAAAERTYLVDPPSGTAALVSGPPGEISGVQVVGNTLWAATFDGGLYRSSTTLPLAFTQVATLAESAAATLQRLGDTLIVASSAGIRYSERLLPVAHTEGLHFPRLAANADGLWLLGEQEGERRLGRLHEEGGQVVWDTVEAKGLTSLAETNAFSGSDHSLLICGENRILELDSRELRTAYRLTAPQLTFAYADPVTAAPVSATAPPAALASDNDHLTFRAALPADEFGEAPRYEHRLLPTETTWMTARSGEPVTYPSFAARAYTLEVRASHLGHKGTPVTYAFTVLPPWYESTSAFVSYVLLASLIGYGGYLWRTRQIRERNAELQRTVEDRTRQLAEASAAKTEFLASMSHEIRNPMNGVIGLVNILREAPATPRQAMTLRMLHQCAEQLRTTVDDILDFSKIEAGRVAVEPVIFDLLDTLEAAATTVDPAGTAIIFLDRPPPGLQLRGDAGKLRQIFANYLTNALKYGVPPGARVSTILTPLAPDERRGGGGVLQLTLSVTSSGPTIAKDKLDKLFESFTRGEDAKERNIRGAGLGLAICRRYAQAMGGDVGAVSNNGETTFYLHLPFEQLSAAEAAAAPAEPVTILPAKALAIEDEDYNRVVLGAILAKMGYTVDWATTGEEALRLARENGYDIVLTDYRLPDTNGVELTKKILGLCPDPKPAVFAVTAYSTRERRDECMNAGMAGFISKPITLEKLRATLAAWGEKNLAKISLESARVPAISTIPTPVTNGWDDIRRTAPTDPKKAAGLAHKLNNLCRTLHYFDLAEQLELLEGAYERGEPADKFVAACERLLGLHETSDSAPRPAPENKSAST